jgi:hypothetical protein
MSTTRTTDSFRSSYKFYWDGVRIHNRSIRLSNASWGNFSSNMRNTFLTGSALITSAMVLLHVPLVSAAKLYMTKIIKDSWAHHLTEYNYAGKNIQFILKNNSVKYLLKVFDGSFSIKSQPTCDLRVENILFDFTPLNEKFLFSNCYARDYKNDNKYRARMALSVIEGKSDSALTNCLGNWMNLICRSDTSAGMSKERKQNNFPIC